MISSIVTKILNRTLNSFIDNLQSDQLNISLFSGTVNLDNLSLKKTILDNFPLPFRLEYGYVGKIFVDIPITNIGSSPVKINISNVFALLKLKNKESWDEKTEIAAFQNSKHDTLDGFEEMQETTRDLKSKDPGYFSKLASKIIDNVQINVENIFVTIEDDFSYPGHPFSTGVIVKSISAMTIDDQGNIKFVVDADQVYKRASINGLTVFFNYSDKVEDIFIEHLMKKNDQASFVEFAKQQCIKGKNNRSVINPVNTELLLVLNKDPKKNLAPQIMAKLSIGEIAEKGKEGNYLGFNVELEQIPIAMKLLEYTGMYSKFQTGVLVPYQGHKFTKEEREAYKLAYRSYIESARKGEKEEVDEKRKALVELEDKLSLAAIKKIRAAERLQMDFEERKEEAKKDAEAKVKIMESQKKSSFSSFKSFFGSSSAKEDQKKVKEAVDKYREDLLKEQEEKFEKEQAQMEKELNELFSTTAEIDVKTALDMPANYERFRFTFTINKFTVSASQGLPNNEHKKMIEVAIEKISAGASISKTKQMFTFSVESFDIFDYLTKNSDFKYLLESRRISDEPKCCFNVQFSNDSEDIASDLKLILTNNCQLRFCANFCTIFSLASEVSEAVLKENIETAYYKDFAKAALSKIDQYIQLGVSYAKDAYSTAEIKHFNIGLIVNLAAPFIIIPEDSSSPDNSSLFACDLGIIRVRSKVQRKDTKLNYKEIIELAKLYDYYELKLEKIQIYIENFKETAYLQHKYVRDLSLHLRLYNCLEPLHPTVPIMKVGGILNRVDIVLTDYNILYMLKILSNLQKEQERLAQTMASIHKKAREKLITKQFSMGITSVLLNELEKMESGEIGEEVPEKKEEESPKKEEEESPKKVEVKVEEEKVTTPIAINPDKRIREVMIHFDDINIIIGRTVFSNDPNYKVYLDYIKANNFDYPGEVPFIPDLRMGINGINAFVYMTFGGLIKTEFHIFRLYARDLQAKLVNGAMQKLVGTNFEYVLANPKVEAIKANRKGDNYLAFKTNIEFFNRVEKSDLFKEAANQLSVSFELDSASYSMKLDLTMYELAFTFPHLVLVAPLNLLTKIKSALEAQAPKEILPAEVATSEEGSPKKEQPKESEVGKSFSLILKTKIEGVYLKIPINCMDMLTTYYEMGMAIVVDGEIATSYKDGTPESLRKTNNINVIVNRFEMIGCDKRKDNLKWDVIPPAELALTYKNTISVSEDLNDTDITLKVKPIDVIIGFGEIEMIIEYTTNLFTVMNENSSKEKPKEIKAEAEIAVKDVKVMPAPKPLTTKSSMKIAADLEKLMFVAQNDKVKQKYPLARMWISDLAVKMIQNTVQDAGTSRDIDAFIGTFQCELGQSVDFVTNEKYYAFMKFGMNSLKTHVKMEADQSMDVSASMFRLFMQDCQINDKNISLVAKEFQYLICNPKLEKAGEQLADKDLGQLEVKFITNTKESTQALNVVFSDFRVTLIFPTVKALLIFTQQLQKLGDDVTKKLNKLQSISSKEEAKEVKAVVKPENKAKPSKGQLTVIAKIANIETWVPIDPTKENTEVAKYAMSNDIKFVNAVDENGVTSRLVETDVKSLSIIFSQGEKFDTILSELSIELKYNEKVGIERDIYVDVKPIVLKITFQELKFFQLLTDNVTKELDQLLAPSKQPGEEHKEEVKKVPIKEELKTIPEAKEVEKVKDVEPVKESAGVKMKVVAKVSLMTFILEDDLVKYKYPLIKMWIANVGVDTVMDPINGMSVSAHVFEIAAELGQMFNQDTEDTRCYEEYFNQLPFSNIEVNTSNTKNLYRESMGLRIDGLETEYKMDAKGNMKADAKMWRFRVKDKQVILRDSKYQPILDSNFQNIIANKRIEEICAPLDVITNYEERIARMKDLLKEQQLSQFHFSLDLNKNQDTNINFVFSEFHVVFAAQTVISLGNTLRQVNHIQNNLLPQLLVKKVQAQPAQPTPPKVVTKPAATSQNEMYVQKVLGQETKFTFKGELTNLVFMLPKTGLKNSEKVAKFSLSTKVDVNAVKTKESSNMAINARVEEICLDILKGDKVFASLIEKTKVTFDMIDDSKEATKKQVREIKALIDPIKVHVRFSHLSFFANASAGILANLPSLQQAGQIQEVQQTELIKEKAAPSPPQLYHKITNIDAGMKFIEFILFNDTEENQRRYPWIRLVMTDTGAKLTMEEQEGKQTMKGAAGIGAFTGEVNKKLVGAPFRRYIKNFERDHDEALFPYIPTLQFGFEDLEASIAKNIEEDLDIESHLHKLYLKDVDLIAKVSETDSQIVPAIASDFQDIISNPSAEQSKLHQLEIIIRVSKKLEETAVKLTYSDFRIVISPPLIVNLFDAMNIFTEQMALINGKMKVKGALPPPPAPIPSQEPEIIKGTPGAAQPTKKLRFNGEITNFEIWVPRNAEVNTSRICQFSLTTKVTFNSVETSVDNKLLTRTMKASVKIYQLAFIMINKHLLQEGDPITKASIENIMLPSRISLDFKQSEDTRSDEQIRDIYLFIEPISITLGFREIAFFRSLQQYFMTNFADKLPKTEAPKQEKVEVKEQVYAGPQKFNFSKNTMNVDVRMDPFNFILSDDTGVIEQHLFKFLISNMTVKLNMTTLIDESVRDSLYKDTNYLLIVGSFLMEALYYNSTVADYEPVIENWGLGCEIVQHSTNKGKEISVQANKMLEFNLSYAVGNSIGVALKKMNEMEGNWLKEQEEEKFGDLQTVEAISNANKQYEGFIFDNKLGTEITFYVQTMSGEGKPEPFYNKYTLPPNELKFWSMTDFKSVRKEESKKKYGQPLKLISEDMLRIMVQINGWKCASSIPIELGGCHSFVFASRMPKKKEPIKDYCYPVICRVGNNKSHKVITFESNIVLANNSLYDLTFYSLQKNQKFVEDSTETLQISSLSAAAVPYKWLCENRQLGILCKKNKEPFPLLLLNGLMGLFKLNEKEMSSNDLLTGKIPLKSSVKAGSESINLTCNLLAFACHKISKATPYQYVLSFDAPVVIHNYLPHFLEMTYNQGESEENQLGLINSQEAFESYAIDGEDFMKTKVAWKVHIEEGFYYACKTWQPILKPNEPSEHRAVFLLYENNNAVEESKDKKKGKLELNTTVRPNYKLVNKYGSFELRTKVFEYCSSKKIVIFARYAVVNKTDLTLKFGIKDKFENFLESHSARLFDLSQSKQLSFTIKGFGNSL